MPRRAAPAGRPPSTLTSRYRGRIDPTARDDGGEQPDDERPSAQPPGRIGLLWRRLSRPRAAAIAMAVLAGAGAAILAVAGDRPPEASRIDALARTPPETTRPTVTALAPSTTALPAPSVTVAAPTPAPPPVPARPAPARPSTSTTMAACAPAATLSVNPIGLAYTTAGRGLLAGTGVGSVPLVLATEDGGRTWRQQCLPRGSAHLLAVSAAGGRAWAVGSAAAPASGATRAPAGFRSGDGGRTWAAIRFPVSTGPLRDVTFVDDRRGWAVGRRSSASGRFAPAVISSRDGGVTWSEQDLPPEVAAADGLDRVVFVTPERGWAGGAALNDAPDALVSTTDGGATWRHRPLPAGLDDFRDIAFTGLARGWLLGVRTGGATPTAVVLGTIDGGETWTEELAVPGTQLWRLATAGPRAWAVGGSTAGEVYTTAGDGTWARLGPVGPVSLQSASFADAHNGWVASVQRACLWRTEDGGASWTAVRPSGTGACDR